ncbi:6952_t:CDS:2, partial [Gigaspora rosea]
REQNEIELVLFVPIKYDERDPETQAVFEKDCFYSVGGKIVPSFYGSNKRPKMTVSISTGVSILNKVSMLNKCPLKVSLVGFSQESPRLLANDDNDIFDLLINDYAGQEYNFIVKIVFPHSNSSFLHLKTKIHQQASLVFVVGQLEVIDNNFYVYAKEINFIDTELSPKQQIFDNRNSSEAVNTIRSKLLSTHKNVIDDSKESSKVKSLPSTSTNEFNKRSNFNLHDVNNEDFYNDEAINTNIFDDIDENKGMQKKKKRQKGAVGISKKGKESVEQLLIDSNDNIFCQDDVIDTNELDLNLESDDSLKKKKSPKSSVRNSTKGGKRGGRSLCSTSRSNNANSNSNVKIE